MIPIDVEMFLAENPTEKIFAYGMVTINHQLKFPVKVRTIHEGTEKQTSFISYPRRFWNGQWEDLVKVPDWMKEEIAVKVGEQIKELISSKLEGPSVKVLDIQMVRKNQEQGKMSLVGIASVEIYDMKIHGITIKKGEQGLFINMPQYKKSSGSYQDVIYGINRQMQIQISKEVLGAYKILETYEKENGKEGEKNYDKTGTKRKNTESYEYGFGRI